MTSADYVLVTVFIAGLVLLIFGLVWISGYLSARRYAPLIARFGFEHATDSRGRAIQEEIEGEWEGHPAHIRYRPGSRSEPASITFTLQPAEALPIPGYIRVRRKRLVDRIAVAIGLARRLWKRTYSDSGRAFVEAEDDRYAEALVRTARFRQSVLPLIDYLRPSLSIEPNRVSLMLKGPFLFCGRKLRPDHVAQVFRRLKTVCELQYSEVSAQPDRPAEENSATLHEIPAFLNERMQRSPLGRIVRPLTLAAAALMFIGPLMLWWGSLYPPLTWDLHLLGLGLGGALTLIYAILLFPLVRGHSQSLNSYSTMLFFAVVGFPTFIAGMLIVANGLPDTGEVMQVEGHVIGKRDEHVTVAVPLEDGRTGEVHLKVSRDRYNSTKGNERLVLIIKPGMLEHPWFLKEGNTKDQDN